MNLMNLSTRVYLRNFSLVKMWLPTRGGVPQDPLRCSAATHPISDLRKQRASDWRHSFASDLGAKGARFKDVRSRQRL